jgi:hypothetical protein
MQRAVAQSNERHARLPAEDRSDAVAGLQIVSALFLIANSLQESGLRNDLLGIAGESAPPVSEAGQATHS